MPASSSYATAVTERLAVSTSSAAELIQALGVSQGTVSRALRELERQRRVLRMGSTRGARYALRRPVDSIGSEWPIYRVDEEGTARELSTLNAIQRDSYHVTSGPERIRGLFEGVPYYLQDARPAGFLGRAVPTAYPELSLPTRVLDWTDDHFLVYLTRRSSDAVGNLIVGREALDRYLEGIHGPPVVSPDNRMAAYPELATAAMGGKAAGTSAHGEQPKFTVCVADGNRRTHVLVKFSPPRSTPTGERWADLLTAEFIAHRVLEEHGIAACPSSLLDSGNRLFLECERFDRVGADGRRGVVSLHAVDTARYGNLDNWTASAERLLGDGLLSTQDTERIRFLDAFGALIANTDRHFGNLTVFDRYEELFELAPVYDMLPMLFAPQNGQIVAQRFEPMGPRAAWLSAWAGARGLAESYWDRLAHEPRVSDDFRQLCAQALAAVQGIPTRGSSITA